MRNYDDLQIWAGADYAVNDVLTIHQPKVGEVIDFGERRYFGLISVLTATPTEYKAPLFDMGIDWENITDYDMFILFSRSIPVDDSRILLGNLDLSSMEPFVNGAGEVALKSGDGVVIDKNIYYNINSYISKTHGIKKKRDVAGNAFTKRMLIKLNREELEMAKSKPYTSRMLPLISALVNSPGFKYNSHQVRDIGIVEFFDSVNRTQAIRHANAILNGMCTGMVDSSKISESSYNIFKDLI
nr:MAG TPA: hypothetical protein [Caudoviricetes sp.]